MEEQLRQMHRERIDSLQNEMILRDYLAMDRTVLANQRTLLAYFRTFIGLVASGIGIIKLLEVVVFNIIGWVFIGVAPFVLAMGIYQYKKFQRKYRKELYQ